MDYDDAYANGAYISGADAFPDRWMEAADAFRVRENIAGRIRVNLPYGQHERQCFDLLYPDGKPKGVMIFVHGGYWLDFDKSYWSHFAKGALEHGWMVAVPSYRLAPEVRIFEITQDIAAAVTEIANMTVGPIVLTGHSAGGHLVARMNCPDVDLLDEVRDRIQKVVPISPLGDLAPLRHTKMNEKFMMDALEVLDESPITYDPIAPVHIWVGANERPAFVAQASDLATAWDCPITLDPDRHHFDVINGLEAPNHALMATLLSED
ncbi:MAG: alpha/beta hydrolase [Halocynthiibacter sp.]